MVRPSPAPDSQEGMDRGSELWFRVGRSEGPLVPGTHRRVTLVGKGRVVFETGSLPTQQYLDTHRVTSSGMVTLGVEFLLD